MVRFIKPGRIVILLTGRFAGKKAVIVKCYDDGSKERKFPHCLVAGIEKPPLFVTKKMHEEKQKRRMRVKPFVRFVNYQHMMPTRYVVPGDFDLKTLVTEENMTDLVKRKNVKKELRNYLTEKYTKQAALKTGERAGSVHTKFLFTKLRF